MISFIEQKFKWILQKYLLWILLNSNTNNTKVYNLGDFEINLCFKLNIYLTKICPVNSSQCQKLLSFLFFIKPWTSNPIKHKGVYLHAVWDILYSLKTVNATNTKYCSKHFTMFLFESRLEDFMFLPLSSLRYHNY